MRKIFLLGSLFSVLCLVNASCKDGKTGQGAKAVAATETFTPESFQQLIKENEVIVVDFKADWCGPCKMLAPKLEKVAAELGGKVKLQKIDVDESPEVAKSLQIQGIPYVVKYVKGEAVKKIEGNVSEEEVRNFFAD
ncbi:MAG: thioredoxin [Sphingobacteriales bacterium]|nr:MAG: thioredoxin [Sphingobacteriales bacterium]